MTFQRPACIITGCYLHLHNEDVFVMGDLFLLGHSFVFSGNSRSYVEADRKSFSNAESNSIMLNRRVVSVNSNYCYESRGIFVFQHRVATLNEVAMAYVGHEVLAILRAK